MVKSKTNKGFIKTCAFNRSFKIKRTGNRERKKRKRKQTQMNINEQKNKRNNSEDQ